MTEPLVMAIDAGTGSCRAIVFDLQGREQGSAQLEWTHRPVPDVPGGIDFDTATNGPMIDEVVRGAIESAGAGASAIKAVSTTSMREGVVLYDDAGRELWGCPNIDSRASAEAEELVRGGQAARIFEIAGDWVSITTPARLLWLKRHRPEILRKARSMNLLSDWIATRLTGEFTTEPSAGSSTAMFDLRTRDWSAEIFEMCGVDPAIRPRVVESGTQIGTVRSEAARRCGLVEGTPVVAGGADTQLALLGLNRQPGEATLVGGSFWQMTTVLDEPVIDPARGPRTLCHAVPGQWMIEGIGFLTGLALRWFRDAFWSGNENAFELFKEMEGRAAAVPPGSNGVTAVMANIMQSDSWVHASPTLLGFDFTAPSDSGRDQATRAIMEAGAYAAAYHRDYLQELLGLNFEAITFTGGSAQGTLWPQIIADVMGVPVSIPTVKETTALGSAMLAAAGAGLFSSVEEAAQAMASPQERVVSPDAAAHETYSIRRPEWRRINDAMVLLAEQGVTRPMWRAAGAIPRI